MPRGLVMTRTQEVSLAEWMSEEHEALQALELGVGPGVLTPTAIAALPGLEVMRTMMRGGLPYAQCAKQNSCIAIEAHHGKAVFQGAPSANHQNPIGTINGGWMSAILDSALGSAVLTTLPPGWGYFTVDLNVKFLKVLTLAAERVRAVAEVTGSEGRNTSAEAILLGSDGSIYARAMSVCRLVRPPAGSTRDDR